jgi:hypothetical protein
MKHILEALNIGRTMSEPEVFLNILDMILKYDLEIYLSRGLIEKLGVHASGELSEDLELALKLEKGDRKILTDYLKEVFLTYNGRDKEALYLDTIHL